MKVLSETVKYYLKNVLFVLSFAILPAIYIGGLLQPFSIFQFLIDYPNLQIVNFSSILKNLFAMPWYSVLNWFFASIILVLLMSAFLGNIDNHFRSGKLKIMNSSGFINNNILACSVYYLVYILLYLIMKFIFALFVFIFHILFGRLSYCPTAILICIASILAIITLIIIIYLIAHLFLALIDTLTTGYNFRISISNASELLNKKVWQTILLYSLPIILLLPIIICGLFYNFAYVSNILVLLIFFGYVPILSYTIYYEYSNLTRYDNIKRYYY